jgi:hypothetical protein
LKPVSKIYPKTRYSIRRSTSEVLVKQAGIKPQVISFIVIYGRGANQAVGCCQLLRGTKACKLCLELQPWDWQQLLVGALSQLEDDINRGVYVFERGLGGHLALEMH